MATRGHGLQFEPEVAIFPAVYESSERALRDLPNSLGFDAPVVTFRHVYELGGSLDCATWDLGRAGQREEYFPRAVGFPRPSPDRGPEFSGQALVDVDPADLVAEVR